MFLRQCAAWFGGLTEPHATKLGQCGNHLASFMNSTQRFSFRVCFLPPAEGPCFSSSLFVVTHSLLALGDRRRRERRLADCGACSSWSCFRQEVAGFVCGGKSVCFHCRFRELSLRGRQPVPRETTGTKGKASSRKPIIYGSRRSGSVDLHSRRSHPGISFLSEDGM